MGEQTIKEGETITLDELVRRMQEHARHPGTKKTSRLLLFNAAAALVALGRRVEELDARVSDLTSAPRLVNRGGQHVN